MNTKGRLLLVLPLSLVFVLGCGKTKTKHADVSGTVTYKDQPVTAGTVTFHTEGGIFPCPIKADGTYSVSQLPPGDMVVTIETESANKNKKTPKYGGGRPGMVSPMPEDRPQPEVGAYRKIPARYADKKKSGLNVTVTDGPQKHDFDLKD